jgi:hypothetical protein
MVCKALIVKGKIKQVARWGGESRIFNLSDSTDRPYAEVVGVFTDL